jgi:hypothetical protein
MKYLRNLVNIAKSGHHKRHFKMDLPKKIQKLREEKEKLKRVIASFKALETAVNEASLQKARRGRKSMDAAEGKAASARMRRYWAGKRKQGQPPNAKPIASK